MEEYTEDIERDRKIAWQSILLWLVVAIMPLALIIGMFVTRTSDKGLEDAYENCSFDGGASLVLDEGGKSLVVDGAGLYTFNCIAEAVEMPERVMLKVHATRPLDGWQSDSFNGYDTEWSYDSSVGLSLIIEKN